MMETQTMFDRLLSLPVFQGMGTGELSQALTHVKLDFTKYHNGDDVVCQGDASRSLVCVINGTLSSTLRSDDGSFVFHETALPGMTMIEPYNMFGMNRRYSRTYSFASDGEILTLDREVFITHILGRQVARINMLNIVCNQYQKSQSLLHVRQPLSVSDKVVHFIRTLSSIPKGRKVLKMKMTELAERLGETRLNVSRALNGLQQRGLLTLNRGTIVVNDMELLP